MPEENSFNKLMDAFDELVKENTLLKVKAQYYKQSCDAKDISLNVVRRKLEAASAVN